jgi:hypothetical protein
MSLRNFLGDFQGSGNPRTGLLHIQDTFIDIFGKGVVVPGTFFNGP